MSFRRTGPLHEPLSDEDVHKVTECFRELKMEHDVLTQRYLYMMEEATQLQQLHATVRCEYDALKRLDDGSQCWEQVRQNCEDAGLGSTFNQIVTGEVSAESLDTEHFERIVLRCLVQITDLSKRVLQNVQGVAKQCGDSSIFISRSEDELAALKPERRLRKSLTMQSPSTHKSPKRSFDPLLEGTAPAAEGEQSGHSLFFLKHFVGAGAQWNVSMVHTAHTKCRQQIAGLGRQFLGIAVELVQADMRAKTAVRALAEQSEAVVKQRQKEVQEPLKFDTQQLLKTVFSWKYDALSKAKSRRWLEIEEIVAGYKTSLQLQPVKAESPEHSSSESEELEQSLLRTERLLMKQKSLPCIRQSATPKSQPTSPHQPGFYAELRNLRTKVAQMRRLGKL